MIQTIVCLACNGTIGIDLVKALGYSGVAAATVLTVLPIAIP
ncbi:hypothetical protein N1030_13550 [Desulfovibrio mangrovi]|nr:hypothetical protein [Desulfovibrio mangrovi]UZP66626.1 hypothetical protein N1030_13550 [Desulfovibrio mangrovi]